jgi:PAS domain S-box-containing protein
MNDLTTLFEFLPIGAYRARVDGVIVRANPALVRLNGCDTEAEMLDAARQVGHGWYVDPNRRLAFRTQLERDGAVSGFVSEVFAHKSGERRWVSENAHIVRGADSQPRYYEGTVEDITERLRAEAALRQARERDELWKLALEATGDGVWDWTLPTGVEIYSQRLREMYGYGNDEISDQAIELDRRTHPDDIAGMQRAREAHFQGLAPAYVNEHRVRCRDGQWKWILSRGMVISRDANGQPLRMIGTHTDITERRQADALRQERDVAEAANRAKTEFLSRVSHELRTPLNAILGFSQLMEVDAGLSPKHLAWTHAILRSGNHLLALVDDVLDLSTMQTGQLRVDAQAVDLLAVVDECWAMQAASAAEAGLALDDQLDRAAKWRVRADPTRLRQVVTNLVSNALKYNHAGGRVGLRLERRGEGIALQVADTGPGLDAAQLARLFTPFERLGAEHSGVEGTGLGLALVKQLVESMGGRIEVNSQPGVGSRFTVLLSAMV